MPMTLRELATMAGVSVGAVSLVLNGKDKGQVSAARRERILALARRHGYRSNQAAKALVEGRTYHVALCHDRDLRSHQSLVEVYGLVNLLHRFSDALQSSGYSIELLNLHGGKLDEEACEKVARMSVDGYVFMLCSPRRTMRFMRRLKELGRTALASGATLSEGFAWTDIDRADAIRRAVSRLAREGNSRIAFLETGPRGYLGLKRKAYLQTMRAELGVDARPWVYCVSKRCFTDVEQGVERLLEDMEGITALILSNTYYSDAVTHAVRNRGLRLPEDFRIIAFGDTAFAKQASPPVSHYGLRVDKEVEFGVEYLMEAMGHPGGAPPRQRMFKARFIKEGT